MLIGVVGISPLLISKRISMVKQFLFIGQADTVSTAVTIKEHILLSIFIYICGMIASQAFEEQIQQACRYASLSLLCPLGLEIYRNR